MSTSTTAPTAAPARLHGLDALRALALGLGVVLHSLLVFVPDSGWLITDSVTDPAAEPPVYVIHLFRMTTFMLLAGFFGRMVLHRRGPGRYLRDRLLRIGLPLVAFWPVSVVSLVVLVVAGNALFGLPLPVAPPPDPGTPPALVAWSPGQLWFLLVLVEIVLVVVAVRALAVLVLGAERAGRVARAAGALLVAPGGVLLAAVPYLLALLAQGTADGGIIEPRSIVPSVPALVGYGGAFAAGWALHAAPGALARLAGAWPVHAAAALALTALGRVAPGWDVPLVVPAAVVALAGTTWTFALLGLFAGPLDRESRVVRYLADSAYWVYLLHLPVLLAVAVPLAGLAWPIPVKLALTWAVSAVVLLVSYDVVVRSTWVGRWLNGRRRRSVLLRRG